MKSDKGSSLIVVLVLGTVAMLVVSSLIGFANTALGRGRVAILSEQAFRIADAGVERYRSLVSLGNIEVIQGDFHDRNGSVVGTYEVVPTETQEGVNIVSIGRSGGAVRQIEAKFVLGEGVVFHYGIQSGTGGLVLGNNSEVNGNVYSNADITGGNGSSITGDAFAVGSIDNVDTGSSQTGVPPVDLPITGEQIAQWKAEAPRKILGNLAIGGGESLVSTSTIWITGNLTLGNNASISLSPSYGAAGGIIIADGSVSFGNNVSLSGSGTGGSTLLIISLLGSSAISLGNGNTTSVILYAPNGTISIGNNADVKALAAKTISISNNVELNYAQGYLNPHFTSGSSGGWSLQSWKEIQ
jgi:hypothetical protein